MIAKTAGKFPGWMTATKLSNPSARIRPLTGLAVGSRTNSQSRTLDAPARAPGR
jgi:hypothetical protein